MKPFGSRLRRWRPGELLARKALADAAREVGPRELERRSGIGEWENDFSAQVRHALKGEGIVASTSGHPEEPDVCMVFLPDPEPTERARACVQALGFYPSPAERDETDACFAVYRHEADWLRDNEIPEPD